MNLRLLRNAALFLIVLKSALSAAALSDGPLQEGKDYYFAGEFKKAISQFELAVKMNPDDPEPYLWLGKSYSLLADLKPPLMGAHTRLKARMYLSKAVELAPESSEYRRELFDLLLTSDGSGSALRDANVLLENVPESDPDYSAMKSLLTQARMQSYSPENLTSAMFRSSSQTVARLAVHPAPLVAETRHVSVREAKSSAHTANKATTVSWRGE